MKTFKLNILFTILFMSLLLPCFAGVDKNSQEKRVALVIGNAKYKSSPLDNPVKDAKAFQEKLKGLDFEVSTLYDADLDEMDAALKNFYKKADESDLALLYYSGHGIEYEGITAEAKDLYDWHNWLITNQGKFFLQDYYEIDGERLKGKTLFHEQSRLAPLPTKEEDIRICISNEINILKNRADKIQEKLKEHGEEMN